MHLLSPLLFELRPADEAVLFSFSEALPGMPPVPARLEARLKTVESQGYRLDAPRQTLDPEYGFVVFVTAHRDMSVFPPPKGLDWLGGKEPTILVAAWSQTSGDALNEGHARRAIETLAIESGKRYRMGLKRKADGKAHLWMCIALVVVFAIDIGWTASYGFEYFQTFDADTIEGFGALIATIVMVLPVFAAVAFQAITARYLLERSYRNDSMVHSLDIAAVSV